MQYNVFFIFFYLNAIYCMYLLLVEEILDIKKIKNDFKKIK